MTTEAQSEPLAMDRLESGRETQPLSYAEAKQAPSGSSAGAAGSVYSQPAAAAREDKQKPAEELSQEAAWAEARAAILSGDWDMVILDEINYAIGYKMLDPADVAETLRNRPEMVHVILTGRNAHPLLVELADTVTEMREVKHAYQKGILAQRGIEF